MRHIMPISGKDSLATAIWQTAHEPGLPYEFVFNDTRAELPETYEWLDRVEKTLGITITRIGAGLEQIIREQKILPSALTRYCTRLSKIKPMDAFIGDDRAFVYFGLRADEPDRAGAFESKRVVPVYPLRTAGIGLHAVLKIVSTRDLLPPKFFWKRLHEFVAAYVGADGMAVVNSWPEWMRDRVFAWRSRPNCFFCFFQRLYEWVGLLEFHGDLFMQAERIERETGADGFTWMRDWPLERIRKESETIFRKRANAVSGLIQSARQTDMFQAALDNMDIAGTSCGLLCGK